MLTFLKKGKKVIMSHDRRDEIAELAQRLADEIVKRNALPGGAPRSFSDEYPWRKSHRKPARKPPSTAQQFEWTLKLKYGNARVSDEDRKTWLNLVEAETPPSTTSL